MAIANAEEIPLNDAWLLDSRLWARGAPRSTVLTPLYVQRYCGPRVGTAPSWHRFWELIYVFGGRGQAVEAGSSTPLVAGTALIVPPRLVHREESESADIDTLWVGIEGSCLETLPTDAVLLARAEELAPWCEQLWLRTRLPYWALSGMEIDGLVQAIVGRVLHAVSGDNDDRVTEPERFSRVVWHIHANYASPLTVASLAALCDISEGHFYRWFQQRTGTTPMEYVTRVRIENAQELLRRSNMPIHSVAARVGYEDPLYFSRAFRRTVGTGPREWRTEARRKGFAAG
ncbi:MAG TPA: AraC family transcriptional regulator [Capsulimonadaceae bacterium]|jgi:AraC-like DNA-binding protein